MFRLFIIVWAALIAGCASTSTYRVTDEPITSTPFAGFGAEFNPYLYARPNWGAGGELTVGDIRQLHATRQIEEGAVEANTPIAIWVFVPKNIDL